MDDKNPSTRRVERGESVGRTLTGRDSLDMKQALSMNKSEVALNRELWRSYLAKHVGSVTIVILEDPTAFLDRSDGHKIRLNGNGNHRVVTGAVEGT